MNHKFLGLMLISLLLFRCAENESVPGNGHVQFSLSLNSSGEDEGGRIQNLPEGAMLLLTLTTANGGFVNTNEPIPILNFGTGYMTEPLRLSVGNYIVTDFLIVDADREVLYAAPKIGSPLTNLVTQALPQPLAVQDNQVTNLSMGVVNARYKAPEEFGYASFNLGIAEPLPLAVFTYNETEPELTNARVRIFNAHHSFTYNISKGIAYIPFTGNPEETYTMEIDKLGYHTFSRQFTHTSLMAETNGEPLKVFLHVQPGITVQFNPETSGVTTFWLGYIGTGELKIDWRDGSPVETITFNTGTEEARIQRSHRYQSGSRQAIRIFGDVQNISRFTALGGVRANTITDLDVSTLEGINRVRIENIKMNRLDLSKNRNIQSLYFLNATVTTLDMTGARLWSRLELFNSTIENIVYPSVHDLEYIMIDETSDLVFFYLVDSLISNLTASQNTGEIYWLSGTPPDGGVFGWQVDYLTSHGYRITYCCM